MLANNQLFISTDDKNNLSTYVAIPIDSLKNPEEHDNLKVIQNIFIKQLADGSICLVEANEDKQANIQEQSPMTVSTTVSKLNTDIIQKTPSTPIRSRTILLQPPLKKQNQEKPPLQTSSLKKLAPKQAEQKFKCIKCDNLFDTLLLYRDHIKWHRCQKKFKCTKCSSGYNVENNLKIHMLLAHSDDRNTQCPICNVNLTFQRAARLKSHLMLHQVEEFYTCEECDEEFIREDDFTKHMESHATVKRFAPKPLTCSYCKIEFQDFKELRAHVSDHVKLKKTFYKSKRPRKSGSKKVNSHVCSVCNKSFIKNSLLERHERIHSGERPFKCEFCDRGFTQKGTLQIHLSRHTGIKPFSCTLCPAKFNQKGNLRVHIQKTHTFPSEDQKMYKCSQCTCIFKKIATLNGHVTKAHLNVKESETQDTVIDKVMSNLKQLEKQTSGNSPVEETADENKEPQPQIIVENKLEEVAVDFQKQHCVQLTECIGDGTVRKYIVRQKKIDDVRWYFCNYCIKQFKKPSDLIRHIRVHTREKPFKCKQCKTAFSLKSTLISHMKTHKSKLDYMCEVCNTSFPSLRVLNSHLRKHDFDSLPKWQCITCGFLFDELEKGYKHREEKGSDRPHIIQSFIHRILKQPLYQTAYGSLAFKPPKPRFPNTGAESPTVRPFHCGICDARFTKRINLKRHIQYHTGDRKFKCHMCPKSFITSYRLTEHLNYHNNIKKHICKVCGKRFVTASLLKRHLIIHNTHRPYQCPYCDKTFKTLLLCRAHIRQVHKKDVIPKFNSQNFMSDITPGDQEPQTAEFIPSQNAEGAVTTLQDVQEPLPQQHLPIPPSSTSPPPSASENITIQQYLPVSQNSVPVLDSNDIQDPINYQTIYVNINELSFLDNSNLNLTSTSLAPQLKLQNTDSLLLNDIQDSNIMFNIDTLKSELDLPPGEIFKGINDENDVTTTTLPSIAEIPTKTMKLNSFSEKNFTGKSGNSNPLLGSNPSLYPNVSFADELSLPISVVEGCNVFDTSTPTTIFEQSDSTDLSQTDDIYVFTNIMCINCNKVFSSLDVFQDHSCGLLGDEAVQERNETAVDCEEVSGNDNENGEDGSQDVNTLKTVDTESGGKVTGALECRLCKKLLANKFSLDRHMLSHSSKTYFECSVCKKVINGRNLYEKHLATHSDSNGSLLKSCKYCCKEFKKPSDLQRHLRTHTGEKPFCCYLCDKKFSLKSTLEYHIKTHTSSPKRYSCNICNSFFSSKSSLKVHLTIHTGQKPHACSFCDQRFRTAGNRKSHEILLHLSVSKKSAESKQTRITGMLESVASEVLNSVNNSQEENVPVDNSKEVGKEQIVSEETPPHILNLIAPPDNLLPNLPEDQIPTDPVALLQQLQMSGVILTNENEPLILNDITLLNVEDKDNVQVISLPSTETQSNITVGDDNLVKTEKIKNFECDICHKMYASKDVLRKHKKNIHGLNKKFPCIKCDKGFDTQDDLSKHVKLHSGYRPYSCLHCANSFTEEQSLKTHMKRIHHHVNTVKESTSALLNMKFDLPSANIDDPLFNNLFAKKESTILLD